MKPLEKCFNKFNKVYIIIALIVITIKIMMNNEIITVIKSIDTIKYKGVSFGENITMIEAGFTYDLVVYKDNIPVAVLLNTPVKGLYGKVPNEYNSCSDNGIIIMLHNETVSYKFYLKIIKKILRGDKISHKHCKYENMKIVY
jgi:hypothetical protein